MRAIGIVWTFGRETLAEFLACWAAQTRTIPLVIWANSGANFSQGVHRVMPGALLFYDHVPVTGSLAAMRNRSLERARFALDLQPTDAFLPLEDDDYYAPGHVEHTLDVLERGAAWTGSLRVGQQWSPDSEPELLESLSGPGPHAAWGMRFELLDQFGGYPDVREDDAQLAQTIGWTQCTPHRHLTYVRREHGANLCRVGYDFACARDVARVRAAMPVRTPRITALDLWTARYG